MIKITAHPEHSPYPKDMSAAPPKVTGDTVRDDFNSINTVLHYARAAHFIGLWKSELVLIEQYLPDRSANLLEAGCGAGRVAVGLWHQGFKNITAFDFASELIEQAEILKQEQGIPGITFLQADATQLANSQLSALNSQLPLFDGVLFLFNGMMQIPGRDNRRTAMLNLHQLCRIGAHFIFTTHDRDDPKDIKVWAKEAALWAKGEQNLRVMEFGDRYFTDETGNTFMHLPDRKEILEDMAATGWTHVHDATRNDLASETPKVRNFSDNCRFWVARKA